MLYCAFVRPAVCFVYVVEEMSKETEELEAQIGVIKQQHAVFEQSMVATKATLGKAIAKRALLERNQANQDLRVAQEKAQANKVHEPSSSVASEL